MASAQEQGSASAATVLQRHLARALAASQLTSPEQLLVGVAEGGAFLHFLFAYRDPAQGGGAQHYDENLGCVQRGGGSKRQEGWLAGSCERCLLLFGHTDMEQGGGGDREGGVAWRDNTRG